MPQLWAAFVAWIGLLGSLVAAWPAVVHAQDLPRCQLDGRSHMDFMLTESRRCVLNTRQVNVMVFPTQDSLTGEKVLVVGYDLRNDRPQQITSSSMHRQHWERLLREVVPQVTQRQEQGERFVLIEQFDGSWPKYDFTRADQSLLNDVPHVAFFSIRFVSRDPALPDIVMPITLDATTGGGIFVAGLEPPRAPDEPLGLFDRLLTMFGSNATR